MANKAEISWKRASEDGQRLEIYAHHVGRRWVFYSRERRIGLYAEVGTGCLRRVSFFNEIGEL